MVWPETLAESFPDPHGDEPASLRQDIADELADHLQTSLARQLVTTTDETAARERVVDRFGDPRHLARQLWFEAMQEKIMRQRLFQILTAVLVIACLAVTGLLWRITERSRAAMAEMVEANREANEAMLERLTLLSQRPTENSTPTAAAPTRSFDWNPVRVHAVIGAQDRPPAEGLVVRITHLKSASGLSTNNLVAAEETCDASGVADLGLCNPGKYTLTAMFRKDGAFANLDLPITIQPGSDNTFEIVCPGKQLGSAQVIVHTNLPDDLREKGLYVSLEFIQSPQIAEGNVWRSGGFGGTICYDAESAVIVAPDQQTALTRLSHSRTFPPQNNYQGIPRSSDHGEQPMAFPKERPLIVASIDHHLAAIRICRNTPKPVLLLHDMMGLAIAYERYFLPANKRHVRYGRSDDVTPNDIEALPKFSTSAEGVTEWHVEIPADFLQEFREKEESADRQQPEELTAPAEQS
jgi:hypothetical protein